MGLTCWCSECWCHYLCRYRCRIHAVGGKMTLDGSDVGRSATDNVPIGSIASHRQKRLSEYEFPRLLGRGGSCGRADAARSSPGICRHCRPPTDIVSSCCEVITAHSSACAHAVHVRGAGSYSTVASIGIRTAFLDQYCSNLDSLRSLLRSTG